MLETARTRTCARVAGRHVVAIQDTTSVRVDENGIGLSCHPVLAVDAQDASVLGLVDAFFLDRRCGLKASRAKRDFATRTAAAGLMGPAVPARWRKPVLFA